MKFFRLPNTLILFVALSASSLFAKFQVPALTGPVIDEAHLLSASALNSLESALRELASQKKVQLVVLTVSSLGDETIEQVSIHVVDTWKLGSKENDNGVLFLVAPNERRMRIEVGQGLEGDLPDAYAKQIIEDHVIPMFREKRFDDGIVVGVNEILKRVSPEFTLNTNFQASNPRYDHTQPRRGSVASGIIFLLLFIILGPILFIALFLGNIAGGPRSRYGGYWSGGGGWGGGSGGGWGGGGGFSGGGGGFSGGGASGGW